MERFSRILTHALHSWRPAAVGAAASAALLVAVFAGSHSFGSAAAGPSAPPPDQVQLRADSGSIGPWQQSGHAASASVDLLKVAADPRGVLLVGDSTATRSKAATTAALAGRPIAWDLWNGRPTHGSIDAVIAMVPTHQLPETLVVMSGSNDVFEPEAFAPQIHRLLERVGPARHIYWVSPGVQRPDHPDADRHNSQITQSALKAAAAEHPQLHVIDWPGTLAAMAPDARAAMMSDGVHPSPAGSKALAALIAQALR